MTGIEHTWPADAFDAISIKIGGGQIIAVGTDDHEFKLEGETPKKKRDMLSINQNERWLQLSTMKKNDNMRLTLHFPRHKAWLLELAGHQGRASRAGWRVCCRSPSSAAEPILYWI